MIHKMSVSRQHCVLLSHAYIYIMLYESRAATRACACRVPRNTAAGPESSRDRSISTTRPRSKAGRQDTESPNSTHHGSFAMRYPGDKTLQRTTTTGVLLCLKYLPYIYVPVKYMAFTFAALVDPELASEVWIRAIRQFLPLV